MWYVNVVPSFVTDQCDCCFTTLQVSDFMANDKERDATADEGQLTQVTRMSGDLV